MFTNMSWAITARGERGITTRLHAASVYLQNDWCWLKNNSYYDHLGKQKKQYCWWLWLSDIQTKAALEKKNNWKTKVDILYSSFVRLFNIYAIPHNTIQYQYLEWWYNLCHDSSICCDIWIGNPISQFIDYCDCDIWYHNIWVWIFSPT